MDIKAPQPVLTFPTVNLNGTSALELQRQCEVAHAALRAALEALGEMSPNARDYQTRATGDYAKAREQHLARERALAQVRDEIMAIWEAVVEQS